MSLSFREVHLFLEELPEPRYEKSSKTVATAVARKIEPFLTLPFLRGGVATVLKPAMSILGRDGKPCLGDRFLQGFWCASLHASQIRFDLREGLFNGGEIGGIGW